jgi:hypothetical protein
LNLKAIRKMKGTRTLINKQLIKEYDIFFKGNYHYIYGGVFNEYEYSKLDLKVLFVLKEVIDDSKNEIWSLVDLINNQINEQKFLTIWKRIGELSFGLYNDFPPYHSTVTAMFHNPNISEGLEKLAVINLKKTGGKNQSEMSEIRESAIENRELIIKELEIINPDLFVCGGNFDIVCELLDIKFSYSKSGARIAKFKEKLLIEFLHPGFYMLSPKIMYAYFKEVMNNLNITPVSIP